MDRLAAKESALGTVDCSATAERINESYSNVSCSVRACTRQQDSRPSTWDRQDETHPLHYKTIFMFNGNSNNNNEISADAGIKAESINAYELTVKGVKEVEYSIA